MPRVCNVVLDNKIKNNFNMSHINNINCFNNNSTKPNTSHPTPNNQQPASNVCADKLTDPNINIFLLANLHKL